ncbi:MAG: flagellar hook protein FlgE [Labilithrix sp.]|nr:flagellar hook protein FlgE [Labilithrix sp.]
MSITKAMYSGVSGLTAESNTLSIVGENIANTNTIGFKRTRATFENVLGGAIGSPDNVGGGVRLGRAQQIFAQGALVNTGQATDVALSGDGFFVVNGTVNGVSGSFYTRAGQLTIRNDGVLVNPQGMEVQGYGPSAGGGFDSRVGRLQLSTAQLPPKPTASIAATANLDASATPPTVAWDPQNPGASSNLSTTMTVYDSLGKSHAVDLYFTKTGDGTWDVHALAKGDDVNGGTPGENFEFATGQLTFDSAGALQDVQWSPAGEISFNGATPNQAIAIDFGTSIAAGGTGLGGTTQFGSASAVSAQSQDGYGSGDLAGVKIDSDGTVSGVYSNGQTVAAGKMAIAKFRSNDGLGRAGQNMWVATRESGEAAIGAAGEGGRGAMVAGSLEQSNVDIAEQFVSLIAHQRAFQANSKTITTADQMLQEMMHLKQ